MCDYQTQRLLSAEALLRKYLINASQLAAVNDAHLSRLYYGLAVRRQRFRSFIKRLRGIIGEINSWQDNGNFIFTAELKPINQAASTQPNCCHWL